MRFAFSTALLLCLLIRPAIAEPSTRGHACALKDKSEVTLSGIARNVRVGAMEPGESFNTTFILETSGPPCGTQDISVFAPGFISCISGEKVTVRGVYYAPGPIIDWSMIDMAKVTCDTAP